MATTNRTLAERLKGRARREALRAANRAGSTVAPRVSSNRTAALYYSMAPGIFGREQRAVLAGRKAYEDAAAPGSSRYLLRRNIHMIEKGLSMRPRRSVFAKDYIEATVRAYRAAQGDIPGACELDRELQWANDVLTAYFEAVGGDPVVDRARKEFVMAPLGMDDRSSTPGLSPYRRVLGSEPPVSYDDLLALSRQRRSVRWFDQRPVPRDLIEKAIEVAALAPSACNRQPYEFRVFDDPALVHEAASIPMGTRGWVDNIPMFVVLTGTLSAFFSERDRHTIYTDGCLAAMAFVYALETLGLASCCVNWPDIADRERRMAALLELEPHERPVMCIAIGFPDPEGLVPFSNKREPHEIVRYNRS
jgi:nitroreductase